MLELVKKKQLSCFIKKKRIPILYKHRLNKSVSYLKKHRLFEKTSGKIEKLKKSNLFAF